MHPAVGNRVRSAERHYGRRAKLCGEQLRKNGQAHREQHAEDGLLAVCSIAGVRASGKDAPSGAEIAARIGYGGLIAMSLWQVRLPGVVAHLSFPPPGLLSRGCQPSRGVTARKNKTLNWHFTTGSLHVSEPPRPRAGPAAPLRRAPRTRRGRFWSIHGVTDVPGDDAVEGDQRAIRRHRRGAQPTGVRSMPRLRCS